LNRKQQVRLSKWMSRVLRHRPEEIGLQLDAAGWAKLEALLAGLNQHGGRYSMDDLLEIVRTNDKQRFALSTDGHMIRASQGHSLSVDLGLAPKQPPDRLFHGTTGRNLASIQAEGLLPRSRQHVHLSLDWETARSVGARHGSPVVLEIQAGSMHAAGYPFYLADNGVWLVERVPPGFITISDGQSY